MNEKSPTDGEKKNQTPNNKPNNQYQKAMVFLLRDSNTSVVQTDFTLIKNWMSSSKPLWFLVEHSPKSKSIQIQNQYPSSLVL